MILRRSTLIVGMLVLGTIWLQRDAIFSLDWFTLLSEDHGPGLNATHRSQIFVLPEDRWVEFPIPAFAQGLRVVTNASVPHLASEPTESSDSRSGWRYRVDFQLLNSDTVVVDEGSYNFRTGVTKYKTHAMGQIVADKFFVPNELVPCDSQTMAYDLLPWSQACTTVRLRVHTSTADIHDVAVRVYYQRERPKGNSHYAWYRLTRDTRSSLCRGLVYPHELTTPTERQNLLRWQWSPSHPRGVEGIDYNRRLLYYVDDIDGDVVGETDFAAGDLVTPDLQLSVPVPIQGGSVQLEFAPTSDLPANVTALWQGSDRSTQAFHWTVHRQLLTRQITVPPGILVISTDQTVTLRPTWIPPENVLADPTDTLLPTSSPMTTHWIRPNEPLEYAIRHVGGAPTPFRVSLRQPANHSTVTEPVPVRWYALDVDGHTLAKGILHPDATPSPFDLLASERPNDRVSESRDYHFALPPQVTQFQLSVDTAAALATCFTRPPHIPRVVTVPDDYGFNPLREDEHRSWFLIHPVDFRSRLQQNQTARLLIARRPLDLKPFGPDDEYTWESFLPTGDWTARELLIPLDEPNTEREETIDSVYYECPVNSDVDVTVVTPRIDRGAEMRIIYSRESSSIADMRVYLDGQLFEKAALNAKRGEIELPILPAPERKSRTLRIEVDEPCQVYVRHIEAAQRPAFVKLTAQRFDGTAREFIVEKTTADEEMLRLRVFRCSSQARCRLSVEVLGHSETEREPTAIAPLDDWTIRRREFDIAPPSDDAVAVLGTDSQRAGRSYTCFLPLGRDLAPGPYRIRVAGDMPIDAYLIMYRIQPGRTPRRQVNRELVRHDSSLGEPSPHTVWSHTANSTEP